MAAITQDIRFRLSLIRYAEKYGVTRADVKYKTNRQYIYRWKRRYNGSIEPLRDRSKRLFPLHPWTLPLPPQTGHHGAPSAPLLPVTTGKWSAATERINFPMRPLGWKTPNEVLKDSLQTV